MKRREFLVAFGGTALAGGACAAGVKFLTDLKYDAVRMDKAPDRGLKRGMVIDLSKCAKGCTDCIDACRTENNVYKNPDGGKTGETQWDIHWIRKVTVHRESAAGAEEREVLVLCNHCDNPPCAQVCPVQATYQREDGAVIVDHHRCIGCRYCMIACPYSVRFFNYRESDQWPNRKRPKRSHGVAESCTLCVHRLDTDREPACVEACRKKGIGAITVGDLNDPGSDVSKLIAVGGATRLREDLGTEPKVYYVGL